MQRIMTDLGSLAERKDFSSREAKLPCRFWGRELVLLMTGGGWVAEGLLLNTGQDYDGLLPDLTGLHIYGAIDDITNGRVCIYLRRELRCCDA